MLWGICGLILLIILFIVLVYLSSIYYLKDRNIVNEVNNITYKQNEKDINNNIESFLALDDSTTSLYVKPNDVPILLY